MNDPETTEPTPIPPASFEELGVGPEVSAALAAMGFLSPMPVQTAVFPPMVAGKDILVQSRTGSGKTAAFGIPLADRLLDPALLYTQALCLCPTRELALQVADECRKISKNKEFAVSAIYGGAPMNKQIDELKAGAQIVAGTPGRVLDHLRRGTLKLDRVRCLVLDEADEMLSMGFIEDILAIIDHCPKDRQTVLFSATLPDDVVRIATRHMRSPERVTLSAGYIGVHAISHVYYMIRGMGRARDLVSILDAEKPESAIIFCNTREDTSLVAEYMRKAGYHAEAISSDLSQKERERVMNEMKAKTLRFLVATDIAARGIDISDLALVVNYTFPESPQVYVHRTGRTGRAGKSGTALSLIGPRELSSFYMLKLVYKIRPEERPLPPDLRKPNLVTSTLSPGTPAESAAPTVPSDTDVTAPVAAETPTPTPAAPPQRLSDKLAARALKTEARADVLEAVDELWTRDDAKQVIARLLSEIDSRPTAVAAIAAPSERRPERERERGGRSGERDRGSRPGERDRGSRPGGEARGANGRDRGPAPARGANDRERGGRPQRPGSAPASASGSPMGGTIDNTNGKEFWEAWVDNHAPAGAAPATAPAPAAEGNGAEHVAREREPRPEKIPLPPLPEGQARVYLNLGQRTRSSEDEIRTLFTERGITPQAIDMRSHHSFVVLEEAAVPTAVTGLAGQTWNGRTLRCEPAKG